MAKGFGATIGGGGGRGFGIGSRGGIGIGVPRVGGGGPKIQIGGSPERGSFGVSINLPKQRTGLIDIAKPGIRQPRLAGMAPLDLGLKISNPFRIPRLSERSPDFKPRQEKVLFDAKFPSVAKPVVEVNPKTRADTLHRVNLEKGKYRREAIQGKNRAVKPPAAQVLEPPPVARTPTIDQTRPAPQPGRVPEIARVVPKAEPQRLTVPQPEVGSQVWLRQLTTRIQEVARPVKVEKPASPRPEEKVEPKVVPISPSVRKAVRANVEQARRIRQIAVRTGKPERLAQMMAVDALIHTSSRNGISLDVVRQIARAVRQETAETNPQTVVSPIVSPGAGFLPNTETKAKAAPSEKPQEETKPKTEAKKAKSFPKKPKEDQDDNEDPKKSKLGKFHFGRDFRADIRRLVKISLSFWQITKYSTKPTGEDVAASLYHNGKQDSSLLSEMAQIEGKDGSLAQITTEISKYGEITSETSFLFYVAALIYRIPAVRLTNFSLGRLIGLAVEKKDADRVVNDKLPTVVPFDEDHTIGELRKNQYNKYWYIAKGKEEKSNFQNGTQKRKKDPFREDSVQPLAA